MFTCVVLLAFFASTQGRAVNISNTWVLPEEGFPVFYRYFRDRISWYEADAVCQFHHANLVTVDTTAQYDAVRAYLKELDISSAVWVGLIRSNPDGDFTWTDYRGLSGDGYWSSAPDARAAPLCAAADPAADYRWESRACGGPMVASFICELPVPQWALGNEGCMVRAIPALTVLYLPESAAVQLTADCGLAGVKRVQCTGDVKRGDLLKDLSCTQEEYLTSTAIMSTDGTTTSQFVNITELEMTSESTTEEDIFTKNAVEESKIVPTHTTIVPITVKEISTLREPININKLHIAAHKNINLDLIHNNNLQSNDIPKLANNNENFLTIEQTEQLEDEKHIHHKMLHDEIARRGNFETIFSQPTDHFVPPLVMAKAKLSDDMTVLSLAEKHAQQLAEQRLSKHNKLYEQEIKSTVKPTSEEPHEHISDKPMVINIEPENKDFTKKDKVKIMMPKKYKDKYDGPKTGNLKLLGKLAKFDKTLPTLDISLVKAVNLTTTEPLGETTANKFQDSSIDLTVTLNKPKLAKIKEQKEYKNKLQNNLPVLNHVLTTETSLLSTKEKSLSVVTTLQKINATIENPVHVIETSVAQPRTTIAEQATTPALDKIQTITMQDIALNQEIIKTAVVKDGDDVNSNHTMYEITTFMPKINDSVEKVSNLPQQSKTTQLNISNINTVTIINNITTSKTMSSQAIPTDVSTLKISEFLSQVVSEEPTSIKSHDITFAPVIKLSTGSPIMFKNNSSFRNTQLNEVKSEKNLSTEHSTTVSIISTINKEKIEVENFNMSEIFDGGLENNSSDPYAIDDTNSSLLSGANELLHRPNRMRRPQPSNKLAKFNPFRILG